MLSRLTTQSFRGLSHSSKHVSRFQGGAPTVAKRATFNVLRPVSTLKSRLLGPITGKSFRYGSYVLGGGSVLCVGAVSLNDPGDGVTRRPDAWPQYVRDRLITTYGYLAASLAVSAAVGLAARRSAAFVKFLDKGFNSDKLIVSSFFFLSGTWGAIATSYLACTIPYENTVTKHAAWLIHAGFVGAVFFSINGLLRPVLMTVGIFAGLSAVAMLLPSEILPLTKDRDFALAFLIGIMFISTGKLGKLRTQQGTSARFVYSSIALFGLLFPPMALSLHKMQVVVKEAKDYPPKDQTGGISNVGGSETESFDPLEAALLISMMSVFFMPRLVNRNVIHAFSK